MVAVAGGMMLEIAPRSPEPAGVTASMDVLGGVIEEKEGESVGRVNPVPDGMPAERAAGSVIGGGANELVVDGVVNGDLGEAMGVPPARV